MKHLTFSFPRSAYQAKSLALSFTTQHEMPPEYGEKWRTEVSLYERNVSTLGSHVSLWRPCFVQFTAITISIKKLVYLNMYIFYLPMPFNMQPLPLKCSDI